MKLTSLPFAVLFRLRFYCCLVVCVTKMDETCLPLSLLLSTSKSW